MKERGTKGKRSSWQEKRAHNNAALLHFCLAAKRITNIMNQPKLCPERKTHGKRERDEWRRKEEESQGKTNHYNNLF